MKPRWTVFSVFSEKCPEDNREQESLIRRDPQSLLCKPNQLTVRVVGGPKEC